MKPDTLESDRVLTEREAAALLAMSPEGLRAHRNAGRVRYHKIGRSIRYRASYLEAFLAGTKVETLEIGPAKVTTEGRTRFGRGGRR